MIIINPYRYSDLDWGYASREFKDYTDFQSSQNQVDNTYLIADNQAVPSSASPQYDEWAIEYPTGYNNDETNWDYSLWTRRSPLTNPPANAGESEACGIFTITAWVKKSGSGTDDVFTILSKYGGSFVGEDSTNWNKFQFYNFIRKRGDSYSNSPGFNFWNGIQGIGGNYSVTAQNLSLTDDTWHHVAWVYNYDIAPLDVPGTNSNRIQIYVDGVLGNLVKTSSGTPTASWGIEKGDDLKSAPRLCIGGVAGNAQRPETNTGSFTVGVDTKPRSRGIGKLSDLRVYATALDQTAIQDIINKKSPDPSHLLQAWWFKNSDDTIDHGTGFTPMVNNNSLYSTDGPFV